MIVGGSETIDSLAWQRALALVGLEVRNFDVTSFGILIVVAGANGAARGAAISLCGDGHFTLTVEGVAVVPYLHRERMLTIVDRLALVVEGIPADRSVSLSAVMGALGVRA